MKAKEKTPLRSLTDSLQAVIGLERKFQDYEYPKVSIVVPVYNNAETIALTLESLLSQSYPDFEVIIVDAGSRDRTLAVVRNFRDERIKVSAVSRFQRYEMLNKGISQSSGEYINFLFPGDFYIYHATLRVMMEAALERQKPDLVYCGTHLRDGKQDPKILLRTFSSDGLKRGQQPTSLQSCWFKTSVIRSLNKFNTNYTLRGGYELMCRFCLRGDLSVCCVNRVLTDYDLRYVTLSNVFSHFKETFIVIWNYFGFVAAIRWLFIQKDLHRMARIWFRALKTALLGH